MNLRGLLLDVIALAGAASFLYGLHLIYPPAAMMAGGIMAFTFSLVAARHAD